MNLNEFKGKIEETRKKIVTTISHIDWEKLKEIDKSKLIKGTIAALSGITGVTATALSIALVTANIEEIESNGTVYTDDQNSSTTEITDQLQEGIDQPMETSYAYYEQGIDPNQESFYMLNLNLKFDENGTLVGDYIKDMHTLLEENQAPMGIVIKLQDYSLADVYLAIDEVKKIIEYYNINFPIYYDVDSILNQPKYKNDKYAYNNNYKMMVAFIEKAVYNGMFIGIAGSAENINNYKQTFIENGKETLYLDTDRLVYSSEEEFDKYKNHTTFGMFKCGNYYYSNKEYKRIIEDNGYNSGLSFKEDYIHVIEPGQSIGYLQNLYGITNRSNLYRCNYNYFSDSKRVYTGYEIKIPTVLKEGRSDDVSINPDDFVSNNENTEYYKGIDISKHNYIYDWEKLKNSNEVDFAILRLCNTYHTIGGNDEDAIDSNFSSHYTNCKKYNIKTGFYIYCQWYGGTLEEMKENARKEAEHFVNYIKEHNYEPDMGVLFFDYEGTGSDGRFQTNACEGYMIEAIMEEQKKIVEEAGYKYGFYSNQEVTKKIDMTKFPDTVYWIAGGSMYDKKEHDISDINTPTKLPSISCEYSNDPTQFGVAMQQITSTGVVPGTNKLTDVDLIPKTWFDYLIAVNDYRTQRTNLNSKINVLVKKISN